MNIKDINNSHIDNLLSNFNNRDSHAFGNMYKMFYSELQNYTALIFRDTGEESSDIIQDIFMNIWSNESITFQSTSGFKAYIYTAIRNNFKNWVSKKHNAREYENTAIRDQQYSESNASVFSSTDIVESETYAILQSALNILPVESVKIFKLILQGYSTDEIAEQMGKQKRTIYNTKHKSINILKNYIFNKDSSNQKSRKRVINLNKKLLLLILVFCK